MSIEIKKFCLLCGLPFIPKWNKNLDPAYMNKACCCKNCEIRYYRKEIKRAEQKFGNRRHGVLTNMDGVMP